MYKRVLLATIIITILSMGFIPAHVFAQVFDNKENGLKPKTVTVFKNGYGYFVSEGSLELKDGWAETDIVPEASLGTFWIESMDSNIHIDEAVSYMKEIKSEIDAISMMELLKANIGNKVELTVRPDSEIISGILKAVPETREIELAPYSSYSYYPPITAQFVLLSTTQGDVAVNTGDFIRVRFPENNSTKLEIDDKEKCMKFKVNSGSGTASVRVSYFRDGISWIPSYSIDVVDDTTASIVMKAVLINEAEKIENAEVSFVIGYPNFKYADAISPMSLTQTLAQFLGELRHGITPQAISAFSNMMVQQSVDLRNSESYNKPIDNSYGYSEIPDLPSSSEGDLFFYHRDNVTLDKGERGYYPVITEEIEYENIYKWDVTDADGEQKVWHFMRLTNSSDHPWTTAPVLVTSDGWKPLAQDTLHYTPILGTTDIKLTAAVDIGTEYNETEVDREREVKVYRTYYDLVTIEGELYLENFRPYVVTIEIGKSISGEVLTVAQDGIVEKCGKTVQRVNPDSLLTWELKLEPGESKTVKYSYKKYV